MNKKPIFDSSDPYASAIKSLVKKTLIVMGVLVILGGVGVGYVVIKSTSKSRVAKSTAASTVKSEVLAATEVNLREIEVPDSPSPRITASPSPTVSATPTPSLTPLPSPTVSPSLTVSPTPVPSSSPSPTVSPLPGTRKTSIRSSPVLDGYVDSKGAVVPAADLRVGSTKDAIQRSFLSFDLQPINIKEISKARLRIYQLKSKGNPFSGGSDIRGDLVNYGSTLDPSDYSTSSISPSILILTSSESEGWREIDITDSVIKTKEANKQYLQLRLHFNFEQEGKESYAVFESSENYGKSNNLPELSMELKQTTQ